MTEARLATNLPHDLGSFLVIELQLGNGLINAHPTDLWTATEREKKVVTFLPSF